MTKVYVSNIPESLKAQDLIPLFQNKKLYFQNPGQITLKLAQRSLVGTEKSKKYVILVFKSEVQAHAAIASIKSIVVSVGAENNKHQVTLHADFFLPNVCALIANPQTSIAIYNIPADFTSENLLELFSQYGKVISASIKKPVPTLTDQRADVVKRIKVGYILFEKEEEADRAIKFAHNQFLGPYQLVVQKAFYQQTLGYKQMNTIMVLQLRSDVTKDDVKQFFCRYGNVKGLFCHANTDKQDSTFYFAVQYQMSAEAQKAVQFAAEDEKNVVSRLSIDGIIVKLCDDEQTK